MFRVGVGRDLRAGDHAAVHDLALDLLDDAAGVEWEFLPEHTPDGRAHPGCDRGRQRRLRGAADGGAVRAAAVSFDPHAHNHPHEVPAAVDNVDLATLLGRSDFVVVACPLTARTRGLIDREAPARMAPHAYLVNIARGAIVDDLAVAAAIRDGRLAGAALDVFDPEPITAGHPLLDLPQTILTPHAASYTSASMRRLGATACAAVLAVAGGEEPAHLVGADSWRAPPI